MAKLDYEKARRNSRRGARLRLEPSRDRKELVSQYEAERRRRARQEREAIPSVPVPEWDFPERRPALVYAALRGDAWTHEVRLQQALGIRKVKALRKPLDRLLAARLVERRTMAGEVLYRRAPIGGGG